MQEKQITVAGKQYKLDRPFFVMATQNPIEMEGTYPLPEAQLDRFLFKLMVPFPKRNEMSVILDRTTKNEEPNPQKIISRDEIHRWMHFVRQVVVAPHVQDYAVRLILATHPESEFASAQVKRYVRFGSSPRGAQGIILAAKIKALRAERFNVAFADIAAVAIPALRHRLVLNFEAEAEGVTSDVILYEMLNALPREVADFAAR
jgi:MoxR-like ATPase